MDHQSALGVAALLGERVRLPLRRPRRHVDAHQPGPHAQARSVQHPDHGQGVAARFGGTQHIDDRAQQRRFARRVAADGRTDLRRHR